MKIVHEVHSIVRPKAISYTTATWLNLTHSISEVKPLNRASPNTPFVSQFIRAEMTGEAVWVNNLSKVATK